VGVAGAGKTTMLRAVAEAFERSDHQVLGTATSGQAARNLGSEAGISESRTLASLIWRLDNGQVVLNEKTLVVLDEAGMTDDVGLVRLTAYVEAAGAKLVLTGDHRQLGPVGPGADGAYNRQNGKSRRAGRASDGAVLVTTAGTT
jgi:ATP-dependent exoDNAse (exonuclease V) alpha subunit